MKKIFYDLLYFLTNLLDSIIDSDYKLAISNRYLSKLSKKEKDKLLLCLEEESRKKYKKNENR